MPTGKPIDCDDKYVVNVFDSLPVSLAEGRRIRRATKVMA